MARDRWKPIERELRKTAGPLIAGVDEVGRGPLAGPVVACAVVMPPDVRAIAGVDDSKQLSARGARSDWPSRFAQRAVSVGLGAASVREIDRVNIYHATVIAMRRALARSDRDAAPCADRRQADSHARRCSTRRSSVATTRATPSPARRSSPR